METYTLPWRRWLPSKRRQVSSCERFNKAAAPSVTKPSNSISGCASAPKGLLSANVPASSVLETFNYRASVTTDMTIVMPSPCDQTAEICRKDKLGNLLAESNASEEFQSFSHAGSDFDFSTSFSEAARGQWPVAPMSSADELFYNGQIRPLWLQYPYELQHSSLPASAELVSASEDDYFDFRSSANYAFSASQSQEDCPCEDKQNSQIPGLAKSSSQAGTISTDNWENTGKERKQSADDRNSLTTSTQSRPSVTEVARRQTQGPSCRTLRPLSPFRNFHRDDPGRQPVESQWSCQREVYKGSVSFNASMDRRRTGGRLTLRELLHKDDSIDEERGKRNVAYAGSQTTEFGRQNGPELDAAPQFRTPSKTSKALSSPTSRRKGSVNPHERHYTSQRATTEKMKTKTLLPYTHSFLSCWGFPSIRPMRSVAGIGSYSANYYVA